MPTICGMEMSSRYSFKTCGQIHLCVENMGETHMEAAKRLHLAFELQVWIGIMNKTMSVDSAIS